MVNYATWDTNTMPESAVNFMEGDGPFISGVVERKDTTLVKENKGCFQQHILSDGKRITYLAASCEIQKYELPGRIPTRWRCSGGESG